MLDPASLVAFVAQGIVVAEASAGAQWPQIVAGALGIGLGVFMARKQIQRWTQNNK